MLQRGKPTSSMKPDARLTTGPIGRTLLMFSLPVLGSNILQSLNASINSVWVGRYLGEAALTATSNANIILFFLLGVVLALAATIASSAGSIVVGKVREQSSNLILTTGWSMFWGTCMVALWCLASGQQFILPHTTPYVLGLLHLADGVEGARRRIRTAQAFIPRFGLA